MSTAEHSATVTVTGHLMDTGILARILDDVLEYGGDYRIESLDLGKQHDNESRALIEIRADEADLLERILMRVQVHGANAVDPGTALTRPAPADGVFPEDFYSTTNLETLVRLDREWLRVRQPEMDCGLVVSEEEGRVSVQTVPVSDVRAGEAVVCGAGGV
ncbi:MAG TPA: TIGR00300 family protein, partial [Blastococcus sp.]